MSLNDSVELAISRATGQLAELVNTVNVSGGSICDSRIVTLKDQRKFFVKSIDNASQYPGMFETEYKGLTLLDAPGIIRVPRPIAYDNEFIILEVFQESSRKHDWSEKIGRQLAQLHLATQSDRYGFEMDNYLGYTIQHNKWSDDWSDFWRERRLGTQLQLFSEKTNLNDKLLKLGDRVMDKVDDIIGGLKEPGVLLHGDLWSGNAAADGSGNPVIYDPACYYGHREAEISMMRMFGGFGPHCEDAYEEVWSFENDKEQRITLYRLYHELNHLNLFGLAYYQSCINTMEQLI